MNSKKNSHYSVLNLPLCFSVDAAIEFKFYVNVVASNTKQYGEIIMNHFKSIFLTVTTIALTACGGGGGGSDTSGIEDPLPPALFSLAKIYSPEPAGLVYEKELIGTSTDGATYTGTISRTNNPKEMFGGVLVTPSEGNLVLTLVGKDITQSITEVNYIDSSDNYLSSYNSEGVTCTPASPEAPPLLVKVGDTGNFPISTCSDGASYEESWEVTDAGDGTIFHIITGSEKDGVTVETNYVNTINIDSAGNIVSYKGVSTVLNGGDTLTLQTF